MNLPTIDSVPNFDSTVNSNFGVYNSQKYYPHTVSGFFTLTKKKNQQRSGERKGSRSLAVSLLARQKRTTLSSSKLPGV